MCDSCPSTAIAVVLREHNPSRAFGVEIPEGWTFSRDVTYISENWGIFICPICTKEKPLNYVHRSKALSKSSNKTMMKKEPLRKLDVED
jgi:hypothetical protein